LSGIPRFHSKYEHPTPNERIAFKTVQTAAAVGGGVKMFVPNRAFYKNRTFPEQQQSIQTMENLLGMQIMAHLCPIHTIPHNGRNPDNEGEKKGPHVDKGRPWPCPLRGIDQRLSAIVIPP